MIPPSDGDEPRYRGRVRIVAMVVVVVLGGCSLALYLPHVSESGTPECYDSPGPPLVDLVLTAGAIGASVAMVKTAHGNTFAGIDFPPSYSNLALFFMMITLPPIAFGASSVYGFSQRSHCRRVKASPPHADVPAPPPEVVPGVDAATLAHQLSAHGSDAASHGDCATAKQLAPDIKNLDDATFAAYVQIAAVAACLK